MASLSHFMIWVSLIFLILIIHEFTFTESLERLDSIRLEMVHRHHVFDKMRERKYPNPIRDLVISDISRRNSIYQKLLKSFHADPDRRKVSEFGSPNWVQMPLGSAADYGSGQYLVNIRVGTPARKLTLIADTGSDLTWMTCEYRCSLEHECEKKRFPRVRRSKRRRVFRAGGSTSFNSVPCFSEFCKVELSNLFSLAWCPTLSTPCGFDYRYSDASYAKGIFANETITLDLSNGKKTTLDDMLLGCSDSSRGPSFISTDGVLGLGFSKYSFTSSVAHRFGGTFSYCLMDHLSPLNVSNFLTFGKTNESKNMQFTDLILDVISPFYSLNVSSVSVDDVALRVPREVWDVNGVGGTILDSGMSLTSLAGPAYTSVMDALTPYFSKFGVVDMAMRPVDFCFNSTGFDETKAPRIKFIFYGGATFEPPLKSYVIDAAEGVKCLGFLKGKWPGINIIGNIMQQNHLWEFDLERRKLAFAPSDCT